MRQILLATVSLLAVSGSAWAQGSVFFNSNGTVGAVASKPRVERDGTPFQADSFVCSYFAYPGTYRGRQATIVSYPPGNAASPGVRIRHVQVGNDLRVEAAVFDDTGANSIRAVSAAAIPRSSPTDAIYPYISVAVNTQTQAAIFRVHNRLSLPDPLISGVTGGPFNVSWNVSGWTVGAQRLDSPNTHQSFYYGLLNNVYCHAHAAGDDSILDDLTLTIALRQTFGPQYSMAQILQDGRIEPLDLGPDCYGPWGVMYPPTLCMVPTYPDLVGSFLDNASHGTNPFEDFYGNLKPSPTTPGGPSVP